jgi:hypothetical protein
MPRGFLLSKFSTILNLIQDPGKKFVQHKKDFSLVLDSVSRFFALAMKKLVPDDRRGFLNQEILYFHVFRYTTIYVRSIASIPLPEIQATHI